MPNLNVCSKNNELTTVLNSHFKGRINLARLKLMSHFIAALCTVQTVTFEKLAIAFDTESKACSSLRRIQRFIANYSLSSDLVAKLIFSLLPNKKNLRLTIDRTNWKFGETNINIFMLGVVYNGVAFPLLFSMLDKRGNSNSIERIELVERFIDLFGVDKIESIVADREFVGEEWMEFLNLNRIKFYIRIRNNFKVYNPRRGMYVKASWMFSNGQLNEFRHYHKIVYVNGQACYLSGCRLKNKNGKQDFLIIASFNKPEKSQEFYKERWQIEMCFKAMKSSGFDMEKTHLREIQRIEKLLLLIMVAFVWCYKVGIALNQINPIKVKTHGRKAKSIFKLGLSYLAECFLNPKKQIDIPIFNFLSCT